MSNPLSNYKGIARNDLTKKIMKALKPTTVIPRAVPSVYVVDEEEGLVELYTLFLKETGCIVRAYNHRAYALAALVADRARPELLITDYDGDSMRFERFLQRCLLVQPSLRILTASELSQTEVQSLGVTTDAFIQKPFTADEFVREVKTALECSGLVGDLPRAHELFQCIQVRIHQSIEP